MAEQLIEKAEADKESGSLRVRALRSGLEFDDKRYQFSDRFRPAPSDDPWQVHTTPELIAALEKDASIELDAKILTMNRKTRTRKYACLEREDFLSLASKKSRMTKVREAIDTFALDERSTFANAGKIGDDFMPLIGGPFYKNLYYYQDYIRMHSEAFHAFHHNPAAKAIVNITRDFTLGRGFRVDSDNEIANAVWRAFAEANELPALMRNLADEIAIYGEIMLWKLPNHESRIGYKLPPGEEIPTSLLPRVRLVDPSNIVEIVTYPEDITRRLFYVWLAPTQYQIYTAQDGRGTDVKDGQLSDALGKKIQPVMKFIYRQIPADQMLHFKVNAVSNEKRGRSDFYPVLGYLKMLNDAVKYAMVSHQKQSAYSVDTTVEGSQRDVDNYIADMNQLGTIHPAGSEFAHTKRIERKYLSPDIGAKGSQEIFEWCWSMIAAGTQIPINYFGSHISGGQTRASAIVATEPVAKKFEMRQLVYEDIIRALWGYVMREVGLGIVDCEVTFPEIISQDRSAKLKDLALAEAQKWLKAERCAEIAAKEFGITDYDYKDELKDIEATSQDALPIQLPPLGELPNPSDTGKAPSAMTKDERKEISDRDGQ